MEDKASLEGDDKASLEDDDKASLECDDKTAWLQIRGLSARLKGLNLCAKLELGFAPDWIGITMPQM